MAKPPELEGRIVKMKGPLPPEKMFIKCASITEKLSTLTEITVDFLSPDYNLKLGDMVGKPFSVSVQRRSGTWRDWHGIAVELSAIGTSGEYAQYQAKLRPWLWMLTRGRDNRIFQNMSAPDIIQEVFSDLGFSSDVTKKLSATYSEREYCVQYRESNFDFVSRLMEEEGIYYYFDHGGSKEKLVLADNIGAHEPISGESSIEYKDPEADGYRKDVDHFFGWFGSESVTTGKVTFEDYNFEKPKAQMLVTNMKRNGSHSHAGYEDYDYPGHYRETSLGDKYSRVKMESHSAPFEVKRGVSNVRRLETGHTFRLKEHERRAENGEYMIVAAEYFLQIEEKDNKDLDRKTFLKGQIEVDKDNRDTFRATIQVMPKSRQFRAPLTTPWPEIAGVHTAVVTGPSGEEIYTDKHGRIKVQFHWDRDGKKDEKTTCFIRHMTPWSGKNWGMIHVPRIGQEVVVQFEEGDPDRPLVIGMLYNNDTMPPYTLPGRKDEMGIVTRSTKSGSANTFHELIFKDEKEKELVRFQSERDYKQTIKNNADITIGLEHKDKGDLTQTIHRHKTETLNTGDNKFTIKQGSQIVKIKKDQTETIEGKSTRTITGNHTETIKQGNLVETVKMGNHTETVKMGNITVKANMGKTTIQAMQSIELKCGASTIKLTPASIEIKAPMIKINGSGMTEVKGGGMLKCEGGGMAQFKGGGLCQVQGSMTMVKGSLTMIN